MGLDDYRRFRPGKLSGGLLRRLNIACGIAHRPDLIFFDEPTVAVDPQSRNAILEGIMTLRARGTTVVYTSHYMEEVEELKLMIDAGERITVQTLDLTPATLEQVDALPAVIAATYDGQQLDIRCRRGETNLIDILGVLERSGTNIGHLTSRPPSLNDVFLELTGTALRD